MANTYYDSQLTAEEIESALEAISGLIDPANNGKVIGVENGTLVAKSVTEYSGGGGSSGEVIFQQFKGQESGSTQTISTTLTISKAGYYYLSSGGWLDSVSLTVNNMELPLTSFANYSKFRSGTVQLNVGDEVVINTYGSGRLAIHGLIIFLHD